MAYIGSVIYSAVKPIFKIYLIMGTGFLLAKLNVLTVDVSRNISDMIVMVVLPCLSFNKIVSSIAISDLKAIGVIFLSAGILYAVGAVCAIVTIAITPVPRKWYGGAICGGTFPNISDLPIAYIQTLDTGLVFNETEGNKGIAYVCIFLVTFLITLFNCGGFRLVEYDFNREKKIKADLEEQKATARFASSPEKGSSKEDSSSDEPKNNLNKEDTTQQQQQPETNADKQDTEKNNINNISDNQQNPPTVTFDDDDSEAAISAVTSLSSSVDDLEEPNRVKGLNSNELQQPASMYSKTSSRQRRPSNSTLQKRSRRPSSTKSYHSYGKSAINHNNNTNILSPVNSALTYLSNDDSLHTANTLGVTNSRNLELRSLPSQNVRNVIVEYSRINNEPALNRLNTLTKLATTEIGAQTGKDMKDAGKSIKLVDKYHLNWLIFLLQNFLRPCSMSALIGLAIALIPWLKALFVTTDRVPDMKNAPDKLPPLSFIMDYTAYIGQASVPLGLLMLGTTISRLSFGNLNKKFLISAATLVILKLCVVPIVGVAWASKLRQMNWLDDDMIFFVIVVTYSLPSATTQFYFTASCTDPDAEDTTQMDCLSVYLLMEYVLLAVSLPFVVTYVVEKQLNVS